MRKIVLVFGALAPPLYEQLAEESPSKVALYQRDADAITRLCVTGLLTESETHRARGRLIKRIMRGRATKGRGATAPPPRSLPGGYTYALSMAERNGDE